jgi:hypothetical protein
LRRKKYNSNSAGRRDSGEAIAANAADFGCLSQISIVNILALIVAYSGACDDIGTTRQTFKNACSPALRIPRKLKLLGAEAILRNDDAPLIFELAPSKSLLAVLSRLSPIKEDFEPIADPPPETVDDI